MTNVVLTEPDDASIVAKITSGEADAGHRLHVRHRCCGPVR